MSCAGSAAVIWALGLTQVVGYGTLYYGFSVLAPAIGAEFGWPPQWVFGALSLALLLGGLAAPFAGHLADRFGAARTMAVGSVAVALLLALAGLAVDGFSFAAALIGMEIAASLVLYATAFTALVQAGAGAAQRRITYLTLIAGFASTLFWPLTSVLLETLGWRGTYFVFAALNLLVCAPLHLWLSRGASAAAGQEAVTSQRTPAVAGVLPMGRRNLALGLMMAGFAIEGFVLTGVLLQIMPILDGLSLGASALVVTTLFGPAQVLSRLVNMLLGRNLKATWLAVIAAALLPAGLAVLASTAPSVVGAVMFAVLFGLGSGLTSIVSGALPLYLLGRDRYGARLGWLSSARQVASAIAPFLFAVAMGSLGIGGALWVAASVGLAAVGVFVAVEAMVPRRAAALSVEQST